MSPASRREDLLVRAVEGETIILDRVGGVIHRLNPTAAFIWDRIDNRPMTDLASDLCDVFDIDLPTATRDVDRTVAQLQELGLLRSVVP